MIDLRRVSTSCERRLLASPRDCPLDLDSLVAVNIATQGIVHRDALQMVGRLYEHVQSRLMGYRDGDGRGRCENKFGNNLDRNQAGRILFQLVSQSTSQRLDMVQLHSWVSRTDVRTSSVGHR
jgi:hypothetical protein